MFLAISNNMFPKGRSKGFLVSSKNGWTGCPSSSLSQFESTSLTEGEVLLDLIQHHLFMRAYETGWQGTFHRGCTIYPSLCILWMLCHRKCSTWSCGQLVIWWLKYKHREADWTLIISPLDFCNPTITNIQTPIVFCRSLIVSLIFGQNFFSTNLWMQTHKLSK